MPPHHIEARLTRALLLLLMIACWPSLAAAQDVCWRQSQGRGVGTIPTKCGKGKINDAGLCYDACKAGYLDGGPMCWQACPAGKTELGPVCSKGLLEGCSGGMANLGLTCGRKSYGRGVGTIPTQCAAGEEYDAGLCYAKCSGGRAGVGPVCWQNTCPADFPVSCGMGCSTSTQDCVRSIFEQTTSTLEVLQNAVGAGKLINQARKTAKYVGRAAAKEFIKKELEKAAKREGRKLSAALLTESSAYILGELDDGSGQFDIGGLDPTGIVAVVQAFDKPICGEPSPESSGPTLAQITNESRSVVLDGDVPQPLTDTPTYVTTDNAPGMCLSVDDAGKLPVMRPCAVDERLVFERVRELEDQRVYQIKHPTKSRCLYSNADGRFAFYKCVDGANDQRWYTARSSRPDRFLLLNGNSGKCLFLNKKKLGVYTCNESYDDQKWRTGAPPVLPTSEPVDVFTQASASCLGGKRGVARPGACGDASRHVLRASTFQGQDAYEVRQMASNLCLRGAAGKLAYAACSGRSGALWYTMPTTAGGTQLVHAATGRCLFSNPDGRYGTSSCRADSSDQRVVIKRVTTPAEDLEPRPSAPLDREWVRLGTENAPGKCLGASDKKALSAGGCHYRSGFDVSHVREVAAAYTVRLRHRDSGLCLTARKSKGEPAGYTECDESQRQWWVVKSRGKRRGFSLKNPGSRRCLFMNAKKVGTYECNARFNDQTWRVME